MADLSRLLCVDDGTERLFQRDVRIGRVQLVEVDALDVQALQAAFDRLAQVLGAAVLVPARRARSDQAAFGCDHQVLGVGVKRLGDQLLVDVRAVRVRGIEESAAELVGPAQHAKRGRPVLRRPPDLRPADPHGAEAQAIDAEVADGDSCGIHPNYCTAHHVVEVPRRWRG